MIPVPSSADVCDRRGRSRFSEPRCASPMWAAPLSRGLTRAHAGWGRHRASAPYRAMCARRIAVVTESQRREREASPWTVLPRIAKRPPVLDPRPTSQTKIASLGQLPGSARTTPQLAARIRTTPQRRLVTAEATEAARTHE